MKGILLCSVVPFLMLLTIEPYEMEQDSIIGIIILWVLIVISYAVIQSSWRDKPVFKISTNWHIDENLDDGEKFFIFNEKLRKKHFWYVLMLSLTFVSICITLFLHWWYSSVIIAGTILTEYYGLIQINKLSKIIKNYRPEMEESVNSLLANDETFVEHEK